MQYIVASRNSLFLFVVGCISAHPPSYDPIFGTVYDPRKVHFEIAPDFPGQSCKDLQGGTFWLFGYAKRAGIEYFVLSNFKSEESGVGVVIHGRECYAMSVAGLLGGAVPDRVNKAVAPTDSVLHSLALDVLRRYARAFGGKKAFLEAVGKDGVTQAREIGLVFGEEFAAFTKAP